MINNILIEVLASIAEQERIKIRTRQKEGVAEMPVINGKKFSKKQVGLSGGPRQHIHQSGILITINRKKEK